jgi:hypothetical protein
MARRLLTKKGKAVTITRDGQGAFDPLAGSMAAGGNSTAVFACVGLPPGKSAEFAIGSLVGRNLLEFHLARMSGALDPQPGDKLPWRGKTYTLVWAAVYDPDDTGAVYAKAYGEA